MTERIHSTRLRVDLNSKNSLVFSYPDLLKRHEKALKNTPLVPLLGNDEQDAYYKALLERAAKYDIDPGDDVNSSDEDAPANKDGKGDEYDYEDPFIDDSDMMLDDSYEYSQPEFDGFFVYYGTLDGVENPSTSKKKSSKKDKAPTTSAKSKSTSSVTSARKTNTKSDPIELSDSDDDTEKSKLKRSSSLSSSTNKTGPAMKKSTSSSTVTSSDTTKKTASKKSKSTVSSSSTTTPSSTTAGQSSTSSSTLGTGKKVGTGTGTGTAAVTTAAAPSTQTGSSTNGDKNKKVLKSANPTQPQTMDPIIEQLLEKLRTDRAKETFEVKSKFPSSLRPTTLDVGTQMFRVYHKIDEGVLARLMEILPYNKFTIKKFLVTKSGPGVVDQLQKEIEKQMKQLTEAVNELMPEHIQQYEQKVLEQQTQAEDGLEVEKKFRCNDTIRRTMYEILTMDMHSNVMSNEIAVYHNKPELIESETKARKNMYTKLLPCWPTGWMTTYDISRQYSTYKAKVKNTDQPLPPLPSTSASGSGTKRLSTIPVKRSAPSSSISTSLANTSQGQSPGGEKRKKVSANEQPAANESARKDDVLPEPKNEQDQDVISPAQVEQSVSPSQKSSSMNIASLISGP